MNADTVLGLAQEVLWLALKLAAPPLLTGLTVGILVSVVQTATSIQDNTLSQVPKMAATLVTLMIASHWMVGELTAFIQRVAALVGAT